MIGMMGRRKNQRFTYGFLVVIAVSLLIGGCLTQGDGSDAGTNTVVTPSPTPVANPSPQPAVPTELQPLTTPEQTICNPFNAGVSSENNGLIGTMYYLTDSMPRYTNVMDYIDNGVPIQSTFYFSQLFIPTRNYNTPFVTESGQTILNADGQPFYEYFGVQFESQLTLAPGQQPGWYQMATLSDDGSIISQINSDGSLTTIVNDDGTHPTRMGCGQQAVYLDGTHPVPIQVDWYQGPRYQIALVVLMRPLPAGALPTDTASDPQCGQEGNYMYFDPDNSSAPSDTYLSLLTRGWTPLDNANYLFPAQATNPCAPPNPLTITGFAIKSMTPTSVTVTWTTSIAATDQAQATSSVDGSVIGSPLNSNGTTTHTDTITGLTPNTLYSVLGVSNSSDGQTATSTQLAFTTPIPLTISNFAINSSSPNSVTVSWATSIPSTTQAQAVDGSGNTIVSTLDPTEVTSHTATISRLSSNTLYTVSGMSNSPDGQSQTSSTLQIRTPR